MADFKIFTDGGARGNPGPAAYGAVVKNSNSQNIIELSQYIGIATNNVAEYSAVLEALKSLSTQATDASVEVFMDSEVVKRQLTGEYRVVNTNLLKFYKEIKLLEKNFKAIKYNHIRRHLNQEADALVNKALDALL